MHQPASSQYLGEPVDDSLAVVAGFGNSQIKQKEHEFMERPFTRAFALQFLSVMKSARRKQEYSTSYVCFPSMHAQCRCLHLLHGGRGGAKRVVTERLHQKEEGWGHTLGLYEY